MGRRHREPQALDRAPQLVRSDAGVALRGIKMLVPKELLDLTQIGAGTQQLGGEYVPERVWRDSLAGGDAGGVCVAAECGGQDRDR